MTSGGLLQRPFVQSNKRDWAELPIAERFDYLDYYTTFVDIFRKIDLSLNRVLDDNELNQFGEIVDMEIFKNIVKEDFSASSSKFSGISYRSLDLDKVNYGLTEFGFMQFLQTFKEEELTQILTKAGYDDKLYSTKSKVFVVSMHCERPVKAKIMDNVQV